MPIQSRQVTTIHFWYECPVCGYRSGDYGSPSTPEFEQKVHEPFCARAVAVGLKPVLEPWLSGSGTNIRGWTHEGLRLWFSRESEIYWEGEERKRREFTLVHLADQVATRKLYRVPGHDWNWQDENASIPWLEAPNDDDTTDV